MSRLSVSNNGREERDSVKFAREWLAPGTFQTNYNVRILVDCLSFIVLFANETGTTVLRGRRKESDMMFCQFPVNRFLIKDSKRSFS